MGPLEGLSIAAMQSVFDTNFFGAVRLVKAVLPGMKRRHRGHIVVVSSVMGLQGESWGSTPRDCTSTVWPSRGSCSKGAWRAVLRRILKFKRKTQISGVD